MQTTFQTDFAFWGAAHGNLVHTELLNGKLIFVIVIIRLKISFIIYTEMGFRLYHYLNVIEAATRRCSVKKMFLKVLQNWQENTWSESRPATLVKKRLWHRYFPVNFTKFLRTPFLTKHFRWRLLTCFTHNRTEYVQN